MKKKNRGLIRYLTGAVAAVLLAAVLALGMPVWGPGAPMVGLAGAQSEKEPFELLTEVGYGGEYISYRRTPIRVTVTSNSEDFVGTLELLYADNTGDIINYKQDLVLAAGETKDVYFYIKLPLEQSMMTTRIVDRKEEVLAATSQMLIAPISNGTVLIGILSDQDIGDYGYLNGTEDGTVELRPEDITSAWNMGMLDVIAVDQFDLDSLEAGQIASLEQWVRMGGTLLLGTGSYYNQTLSVFSEGFLSGTVGDLGEFVYSYREGTEDVFSYCPLTLEDSLPLMEEDGQTLIWQVPRDKGSVLVSAIGLELPSWLQPSLGDALYQVITQNISKEREIRIEEEMNGSSVHYINTALNQSSKSNMPNITVYVVVLCIYVLLVGPVLYLILRKLDKRHYMWGAVSAASLLFAGIIFLLGIPTRIKEPYMTYVSYLDYGTEEPMEKTFFALKAPYNRTYNVKVEEDYQISQLRTYGYMGYQTGTIFEEYDIGIREYENGTEIELCDPAAFESFTFIAEGTAETDGTYGSRLEAQSDGRIIGTFTNNLGYDLEKVFFVCQGSVYLVGDVADGQTVEMDTSTLDSAISTSYYGVSNSGFLDQVFGNYYRDPEETRKYNAVTYYLNNYAYLMKNESFFLAVAENGIEENLTANSEMENYGVVVPILPVGDLKDNGYEYSIDEYMSATIEGSHELPWSRYLLEDVVTCEYTFAEEKETGVPVSIWYSALYNNELQGMGYDYFPGEVYFLNQQTGDYDLIFTGGIEGVCHDLTPYLADNKLTIRYQVETEQFYNERYNIVMPILSVTREVKTDGAD